MATKSLYVGNLSYGTTESNLLNEFAAYGASNARIIEGRGFGFVDINADQLEAAIADKHDTEVGGRKLTVNEARPKSSGDGGGGGNRGGYSGGNNRGGGYTGGGKRGW